MPFNVSLPPVPPSAAKARALVTDCARRAGFDREAVGDIEIAVGEATTNAIEHGSPDADENCPPPPIDLKVEHVDRIFVIEVRDRGPGFTPGTVRDASPGDVFAVRGRGLRLMAALVDHITFQRHANDGMTVRLMRRMPTP